MASTGTLQLCDGNNWRPLATEETQTGGSSTSAGKSCADIKTRNPAAKDGVYWINPDPYVYAKPFQVHFMHQHLSVKLKAYAVFRFTVT
jgi:hypothetical protein